MEPRLRRLALALPLALACAALWPAASQAFVGCAVSGTTLSVFATESDDDVRILRSGDAIHVVAGDEYDDGPSILVPCSGSVDIPTVTNTDLISIEDGSQFGVRLDLTGGQFAPGATPEPDGASEIEIRATTAGKFEVLTVAGGLGPDAMDVGRTAAGRIGVNLNAAEAAPDADLEFVGPGIPLLRGGGGPDVIRAQGATGFATPYDTRFVASGGAGRDVIGGGTGRNVITGGSGRDRLTGANRPDLVLPGAGDDRVVTAGGRDLIYEEGGRNKLNCGGGHDLAVAGPRDKAVSCDRGTERDLIRRLPKRDFLFLILAFEEDEEE